LASILRKKFDFFIRYDIFPDKMAGMAQQWLTGDSEVNKFQMGDGSENIS